MDFRQQLTIGFVSAIVSSFAAASSDAEPYDIDRLKAKAAEKARTLAITDTKLGPFGLNQDPFAKPKPVAPPKPEKQAPSAPKIALAKEILKLKDKIQGIGINKMIIGARLLKRNDTINVVAEGKTFQLQILRITADEINFRNKHDQSVITLDMKRDKIFDTSSGPQAVPLQKFDEHPTIELK